MRALVLRAPEMIEVTDVPKLPAGPGQVQLRVSACGICGSDVRYFRGENPWAKQTLAMSDSVGELKPVTVLASQSEPGFP